MTDRDGGPAFPTPIPNVTRGMSLLDYFAGQVLAGICANPEWRPTHPIAVSKDAYEQARAMLAERDKSNAS